MSNFVRTRSTDTVAMVFVDGTDAGLELIKEGFAWAYAKYLPEASVETQQSYTAAEAAARAARIGLWADADPQPPWEYRKIEKSNEHSIFLAMNPEHKGDSTSFSNPVVTRADFTYSIRLQSDQDRGFEYSRKRQSAAISRACCARSKPGTKAQSPIIRSCTGTMRATGMA